MIGDYHFSYPQAAMSFLAIPVFIFLFVALVAYQKRMLFSHFKESILDELLVKRLNGAQFLKLLFFVLAWCFLTLSLMNPQGNRHFAEQITQKVRKTTPAPLIFLIDASLSMSIKDTKDQASRLEAAKEIAAKLAGKFPSHPLALYAFTSSATVLSPETYDHLFFRMMLQQLSLNAGDIEGTDLVQSLKEIDSYEEGRQAKSYAAVVILSDGGDLSFEEKKNKQDRLDEIALAARSESFHGWSFAVIGIGSKEGGQIPDYASGKAPSLPLKEEPLVAIAQATGGIYLQMGEESEEEVAQKTEQWLQEQFSIKRKEHQEALSDVSLYDSYFQFPLVGALIFLFAFFVLPETRNKVFLALIFLSGTVFAETTSSELALAKKYYQAGEFKKAEELINQEINKPNSYWERAVLYYDLGIILTHFEKVEDAIEAYESAFMDPLDPFYLFNKNRYLNLALLHLRRYESEKEPFLKLSHITLALDYFEHSKKAGCAWDKERGALPCNEMDPLKSSLEQKKANLVNKLNEGEEKESFKTLIEKAFISLDQNLLKKANAILDVNPQAKELINHAIKLKPKEQLPAYHLFLVSAWKKAFQKEALDETSPISFLEGMIEKQKEMIHYLVKSFSIAEINAYIENLQKDILRLMLPFFDRSLSWQKKYFEMEPSQCLKSPWDEVFVLMSKADFIAKEAFGRFDDEGLYLQKKVLQNLEKALELLKNPPKRAPTQRDEMTLFQRILEMEKMDQQTIKKSSGKVFEKW